MRVLALLACAWAVQAQQLSPEDQSFIDAALGGGGENTGNIGGGNTGNIGGGNVGNTGGVVDVNPGGATAGGQTYPPCDGGTKSCVPYYQCEEGQIVTDGAGLIDLRFGGSNNEDQHIQHSECNATYTSVCCADPLRPTTPSTAPIQAYQPQCGRRNEFGINARIVGIKSSEAQFGEYPWMAAVLKEEGSRLVFVCGGALIQPNVVATAAHCVYGIQNLVVRLGEWDTQHTTEFYPHVDADVAKVVIHEGYDHGRRNLHDDMALLFLASDVTLQEHIDTICLPEPGSQPDYGSSCIITGWGKNAFDDGQYQLVLKQVELPLVDHNTCQAQLRTTRLGRSFKLDDSFICAGGTGPDACTGDGGSGMVCRDPFNPNRYQLRGLVSWGIGCGTLGVPGVNVDVTYFSSWINNQILSYQPLPWASVQRRTGWWRI